jgi:disulfide bond formation protein DsbB
MTPSRAVHLSRLINIAALVGLLGVLAGSLHLQFGVGEQPCPLCLIQRSAMIGLAVGPAMNLLWGIRARHYALTILAAAVGMAASTRQILLHIAIPGDPGYGPAVMGLHLYTWAFITFAVAIVGCALLLMWQAPLSEPEEGVRYERSVVRIAALTAIFWAVLDLLVIAIAVIPESGFGLCTDDPANISGVGDIPGWALVIAPGILAFALALAIVMDRRILGNGRRT